MSDEFESPEEYRQELVDELKNALGDDWEELFLPGTIGCHELMDRVSVINQQLESVILSHPACVREPQFFELASQAVAHLQELHELVMNAQVGDDEEDEDEE